jgi:hypothetical protein
VQVNGAPGEAPPDSVAAAPAAPLPDRVDVFYFHRTIRCETCLRFESYARGALGADFADDLTSGRLTWSVLNLEDEANAKPVDRYDIFESSLVVSTVRDSAEVNWEKLEAIWVLVSDENAFRDYVSAEVDSAGGMAGNGNIGQDEGAVPVHR